MLSKLISKALTPVGLSLLRTKELEVLKGGHTDVAYLFDNIAKEKSIMGENKAQLYQDIFVLLETGFKSNGFFVEFGATDGVKLSNTYLLEKKFGWKGILAEPGKNWHSDLIHNRSAQIDTRCVWRSTGDSLTFLEASESEFSTLSRFSASDHNKSRRGIFSEYTVETISLLDLLYEHSAPYEIDYMSIDTEGSELEILKNFNFGKYRISIISVEHNFSAERKKIYEIMTANGYKRCCRYASRWDDWYVLVN